MSVRWHILFFGRVQGVGFRFTCHTVAGHHQVSGWVKNLADGSVEMIVEGEQDSIRRYVSEVCESTHGRVDDRQIVKSDASGEFTSMQIRH
ncbi:acylphosphatase [Mariniblastus fucicola]|uniref:acylphosphatase n=1 Tax=Mariniblastus fucicola TaxID=980251 RepID=A0A5B9PD85_9BACT|nr:acylphosphatase [Mariniblastus fucicola]QEG22536.1 Acylphosphatase [Mariniblastus fucicola]